MINETSTTNMPDRLTVVVNCRIKPGREAEFEKMKSNNQGNGMTSISVDAEECAAFGQRV
jgi:hypothetical protein